MINKIKGSGILKTSNETLDFKPEERMSSKRGSLTNLVRTFSRRRSSTKMSADGSPPVSEQYISRSPNQLKTKPAEIIAVLPLKDEKDDAHMKKPNALGLQIPTSRATSPSESDSNSLIRLSTSSAPRVNLKGSDDLSFHVDVAISDSGLAYVPRSEGLGSQEDLFEIAPPVPLPEFKKTHSTMKIIKE
jgi:hypothetical protein